MTNIVDRRKNYRKQSVTNREKFRERYKRYIQKGVRDKIKDINIQDINGDEISVSIDSGDLDEPEFQHIQGSGDEDFVLTGNDQYTVGDQIRKPPGGRGSKSGGMGSGEKSEDQFKFKLKKDEFVNEFFEWLGLPNIIKEQLDPKTIKHFRYAGSSKSVTNVSQIDIEKTYYYAIGRQLAEEKKIDEELEKTTDKEEIEELEEQRKDVLFLDQEDVRYKRFEKVPKKSFKAVMFCVLDVSGSLGELEKEMAKVFFILVYLFLNKNYQEVELRFIRHTTDAKEVDEDEFLYGTETGGTILSSGTELVQKIIREEYPLKLWNIYVSQVTDGDNFASDNERYLSALNQLLDVCQGYFYLETRVSGWGSTHSTLFWTLDERFGKRKNYKQARINSKKQVFDILKEFFLNE